jgi:hypothetical protein
MDIVKWEYAALQMDFDSLTPGPFVRAAGAKPSATARRDQRFRDAKEQGLIVLLDLIGREGWELVAQMRSSAPEGYMIFKRPAPSRYD